MTRAILFGPFRFVVLRFVRLEPGVSLGFKKPRRESRRFSRKFDCLGRRGVFYWAVIKPHPGRSDVRQKTFMITQTEDAVLEKTRELCDAILAQPNMGSIRQRMDAFMTDDKSRAEYESLMAKGQALQEKQQMSLPLSGEEISDFEKHRDAMLNNPVARGFLDAQEELHQIQDSVQKYVSKTLELGRVPGPEDFDSGSCGHGCGCHH